VYIALYIFMPVPRLEIDWYLTQPTSIVCLHF